MEKIEAKTPTKTELCARAIADNPSLSDRAIAALVGCDHKVAGKARKRMLGGSLGGASGAKARPGHHLKLSDWIEANVCLPDTVAEPGPMRLWPWQREIADCITDPKIERVSLLKATRLGFSSLLTAAIGYLVVEQPSTVLYLLPTEADCRGFVVDDLEPLFECSPILRGRLSAPSLGRKDRNALLHRLFPGGSFKAVAGKAPRNLRRHTARHFIADEADAIEASAEGDPLGLGERRTMTYADRKIIVGGTPIDEATSHVLRCYNESDQRVFEVPCAACGAFVEILWRHIEWPPDEPHKAGFRCPECNELVGAEHKDAMVRQGQWRITRPEITDHAGFRINALVSLLPTCSWPKLAAEFLRVKDDTSRLKVFTNTILGEPWRDQDVGLSDAELLSRVEGFDTDHIPENVLAVTAGVDVQDDRLEITIVGHSEDGTAYILSHQVIWGGSLDNDTWAELDNLLKKRWRHPSGGVVKIDAAVIDGSDGGVFDHVLAFCRTRMGRKILCGKGVDGFARPALTMSKSKRGRFFLIGVDSIKTQIYTRLARGNSVRFSNTLDANYFEQLTAEYRVTKMVRGRPVIRFERKVGVRAEALDCFVYALAARAALYLDAAAFHQRYHDLKSSPSGEELKPQPVKFAVDNWLGAPRGNLRGDWSW